jgi:SAM-dependent methyltransferase
MPSAHFHAVLARWGLMYLDAPVAALAGANRALMPGGVMVAAVLTDPERCSYFSLPRRLLARHRPLPPTIDPTSPGPFRYADQDHLRGDLERADFRIEHLEEMIVPVMEAATAAEVIAWARAFGLTRLLNDLPESTQRAWEDEFGKEADALREGGVIRLNCVTRIVVATRP